MPKVQFQGRVLPPEANVTVGHRPRLFWEEKAFDLKMEITSNITNSIVEVDMELNRYDRTILSELRMRALDICRASVNLIALAKGFGLSVTLDSMTEPDGTKLSPITIYNPELEKLITSFQLDSSFDEIHLVVLQDAHLMLILNDLISGLVMSHTAPISCGRALDGLKNHLSPAGIKEPQAWAALRNAINADEAYFKYVTERAKNPRHGKIPVIPLSEYQEIMSRSWTIIDRYFEYKKRGETKPLPIGEFPLLAG